MPQTTEHEQHAANIQPPRRGQTLAQAVDATAREIDMTKLAFNGQAWNPGAKEFVYLTLLNESATNAIYLHTHTTHQVTPDLDPTVVRAAGAGTDPALTNTHAPFIAPLGRLDVELERSRDQFLIVRTLSGTATLRITSSSDSSKQTQ